MRYISKDYIIQEILDTVSLMQLNNETVPAIDSTVIEEIADAFIFSWKELGDYEANFEQCLLEHLRDEFKYNYK
jgi:hypothetical protein